jgi:pimeloyl-ACP methyl ester carboxylesterase
MLVRYNSRGTGLSDREAGGFGLDDQVLDLEAVVDHLGLKSFCLYAGGFAGPASSGR